MTKSNWKRALLSATLALALGACSDDPDENTDQGTQIGETSVELDTRMVTTHTGETAIANFMSDVLFDELNAAGKAIDVAMLNAGSIRAGAIDTETFQYRTPEGRIGKVFPPGPLTDIDVEGWSPFPNDTMVVTVTGTELKSILERSAANLPPDLKKDEGGWFLHASGMTYAIDCDGTPQALNNDKTAIQTEGTRVTRIKVGEKVIFDTAASVDTLATESVTIGVNSFIGGGADGHLAFKTGTSVQTLKLADFNYVEHLKAAVTEQSPIAPKNEGRITITGNCGQPLTQP